MDFSQLSNLSGYIQGGSILAGLAGAAYAWWLSVVKRSSARDIGLAFKETVRGLSSPEIEVRMASAVLLRRFFDEKSELGIGKTPFAKEAISSISAVLRISRTSEFQKVLADGLRYAPPDLLRGADFQRANLTKASLGGQAIDLSDADFFQANLSGATLKNVKAQRAVFYEATLVGTRFSGADLTGANFTRATLQNVDFSGATLTDADFSGATLRGVTIPSDSGAKLDAAIIQLANPGTDGGTSKVFLSRPGILDHGQERIFQAICRALVDSGCELEQLIPEHYDQSNVMSNLASRVRSCQGLVVFGFSSLQVKEGVYRPSTEHAQPLRDAAFATAWNHVEAGMALMQGIPVLLLSEPSVNDGVFDPIVNDPLIFRGDVDEVLRTSNPLLGLWLSSVNACRPSS